MNRKTKNLTIVGIAIIALLLIGTTYAFFSAQAGGTTTRDVSVTSNTTDNLSFSISNDISFTVTQADLAEGGNNKSGNATATAVLTPNNKTGAATMNYYMYLNLTGNGINYSSTNTTNQPELMVQVYDVNNQLVTLSGLGSQKTVKGVTGYDITGRLGLIPLLVNHEITATNNTATTENWQVVITLINLDVDQNDNTNKTVSGEVIVRKNQQLDSPRLAVTVPQKTSEVTKGYVDTIIEPSFNQSEDEIYTIYTVGYIEDDTISGTTYSIDIKNMGIDLSQYELELDGSPQVMTTQNDYNNYVQMKNEGLPITSLSNGNTNSAIATAQELYTYSLNSTELTINDVSITCGSTKCVANITESFNNIIGKSKHSTTNGNNEAINVLYNGIKFNLKKVDRYNNVEDFENQNNLSNPGNVVLADGYIYYHNSSLTNGAGDNSYRYAGANPNNYVCFGSTETTCPAENLYRIIGLVPVDVVIDSTTSPATKETQMLYKLIRNDYENATTLGMVASSSAVGKNTSFVAPSGNQPTGDVQGFKWIGTYNNTYNTWSLSTLNTIGLNTNVYDTFGDPWKKMIANVVWKVGGNNYYQIQMGNPMRTVYTGEIVNPSTSNSMDGKTEYIAKIGMMYVSDYGYAAPQSSWSSTTNSYASAREYNWLYKGVEEWTITRRSDTNSISFSIGYNGSLDSDGSNYSNGVRRAFYLTHNTIIDMTNNAGTISDPYRINCLNCHTVTFNLDGGTGVSNQSVGHNELAKKPYDPVKNNYGFVGWQLNNSLYDFSTPVTEDITLTAQWVNVGDGYLYHHDNILENGANDNSYRYAGANPNNYVCFGVSECSDELNRDYLYRIIGLIPVDVVVDDTNPLNPITEKQFLYKLIKNDYETNAIGTATNSNASKASSYAGPTGNQPTGDVQGFYWKGSYSGLFSTNTWSTSTLNTTSLNINAYGEFSSVWQKKIATVMWKVGGRSYYDLVTKNQMSDVYTNEIIYPSTNYSLDNATDYAAKIGLLYMSDYGYSASQSFWSRLEYVNSNRNSNNWLYKGVDECLITRNSSGNSNVFRIGKDGNVQNVETGSGYSNGVRRVFYLSNNVVIDMTNYAGTSSDPYRVL